MSELEPRSTRILVVDDEIRGAELLARAMRTLGEVELATSSDEAWEKAQYRDFQLVITDQRMPGMTGTELLSRIAELQENTGRILVTAYSDMKATVSAINEGRVHAYVNKPWAPDQLIVLARTICEKVMTARENAMLLKDLYHQNEELQLALSNERDARRRFVRDARLTAIGRTVALVVHDIRTPLTGLLSALRELADADASLATHDRLALARQGLEEGELIDLICGELLEESGLEADSPPSKPQPPTEAPDEEESG